MKILILNGSPKAEKSNTLRLTDAFTEGMREKTSCGIETVHVIKEKIAPCRGCFSCWTKTPGKCVMRDAMDTILPEFIDADVVIWSFPLYYFGMPSHIKALMDRLLPLNLPFIVEREDGGCGHPSRYEQIKSKRHILISTCGFYSKENNYEALVKQFEIAFGGSGQKPAMILCPEGELFKVPQLKQRTDEYLSYVRKAGTEYASDGIFSKATKEKLEEPLFHKDIYVKMSNASWGVPSAPPDAGAALPPDSPAYTLLTGMAAIYDTSLWRGKDIVIEFFFTDSNETYQIALGKLSANVKCSGFTDYTTRIETPFTVWNDISCGKLNGAKAMMEHKYKVQGDFDTMLHMDDYFNTGGNSESTAVDKSDKKTSMCVLFTPWVALWAILPINHIVGGVTGVIASAVMPFFAFHNKLTFYDCIGSLFIATACASVLAGASSGFIVALSYFVCGMIWLISCLRPVPISAWYSANSYGGPEKALINPLFIKTNRILSLCWAALFLATSVWTVLLMASPVVSWAGLINSFSPTVLGVFTLWFQKWYPAKVAAGK